MSVTFYTLFRFTKNHRSDIYEIIFLYNHLLSILAHWRDMSSYPKSMILTKSGKQILSRKPNRKLSEGNEGTRSSISIVLSFVHTGNTCTHVNETDKDLTHVRIQRLFTCSVTVSCLFVGSILFLFTSFETQKVDDFPKSSTSVPTRTPSCLTPLFLSVIYRASLFCSVKVKPSIVMFGQSHVRNTVFFHNLERTRCLSVSLLVPLDPTEVVVRSLGSTTSVKVCLCSRVLLSHYVTHCLSMFR